MYCHRRINASIFEGNCKDADSVINHWRRLVSMYKVIVWGNREQYDLYINKLRYEELKGSIQVEGIVSDESYLSKFDGYRVIHRNE